MALGRMYTVDFGVLNVALAGPTCIAGISATGTTALPIDIQAIRLGVVGAAAFPSNASVLIQLARASSGYTSGGTLLSTNVAPHDANNVAAQCKFYNSETTQAGGTYSAIVGFTQGVTLWAQEIPFTAGSNWAEWVTPGAEWRVAASAFAGVYMTQSSAGTATSFSLELVFAE
jgi:hypothetical protein